MKGQTYFMFLAIACAAFLIATEFHFQMPLCREEVMLCPGGTYVGRNPQRDCEFDSCPGSYAIDYSTVINSLRQRGLGVKILGQTLEENIPAEGQLLSVNGESVKLFEFPDEGEAAVFISSVSSDASTISGNKVTWGGLSHLFGKNRIIALYIGSSQKILEELEIIFGQPFANSNVNGENYCSSRGEVCIQIYSPVCGWFGGNINCFRYPCALNFANACFACNNENVLYWTEGKCPE